MNSRKSAISSTNHSGVAAKISGTSAGKTISAFGMYGVPCRRVIINSATVE